MFEEDIRKKYCDQCEKSKCWSDYLENKNSKISQSIPFYVIGINFY